METKLKKNNPGHSITDDVLIALRKIIQATDLHSRYLYKRVGLTGPQLITLQEILRSGEVSLGALAKSISLSQATLTGIIERLEKRQLVGRRCSEIDRRKVLVRITPEGEKLLNQAPPLMQESFVERFNGTQDWEQAMILSSLQRIVSMLDAKSIEAAPILTTGQIESGFEDNAASVLPLKVTAE